MRALTGTALGRASLVLVAADVLHAIDHARQGRGLSSEVYGAGVAGWIALAVLLVLVARGHRLPPPPRAAGGGGGGGGGPPARGRAPPRPPPRPPPPRGRPPAPP